MRKCIVRNRLLQQICCIKPAGSLRRGWPASRIGRFGDDAASIFKPCHLVVSETALGGLGTVAFHEAPRASSNSGAAAIRRALPSCASMRLILYRVAYLFAFAMYFKGW